MRRTITLALAVPLLSGAFVDTYPATRWSQHPGKREIKVTGRIEPPMVDDIRRLLRQNKRIRAIELDSWGGDSDEGMRLAAFVHRWRGEVVVLNTCNSACSFAALTALAQGQLYVGPSGTVSVHQSHYDDGSPALDWTKMSARILRTKYGVHPAPLADMVATPPNTMTVYTQEELVAWGAHPLDTSWLGYIWRLIMELFQTWTS